MAQEVKFPYQAVVRDSKDHNLWNEKPVKVNVVITQNGETKWEENFTDTTNFNGLLSFNVGEGTPANCTNCNLELIDWSDNVVIKSTFKDPNDGDREISVVETPVMAVPYALQAKNAPLTLTTPQIVKYISEVKVDNTKNDVDSILDAIVANPNGLKQYCKDTVYHYFMNHKQEMRDLALYFIHMVDAQDVNDAYNAVSAEAKAKVVDLAKSYIMNEDFKDDAMEIVSYYIENATKQDIKPILDKVKSNHAFDTVGDFLADTAIKYIKAHPEKVQEVVDYYIQQATPTQVDHLLNKLKANQTVYTYLVQKFDTHLENYLQDNHYITNVCGDTVSVEYCTLVDRLTTLENSVKNNCAFSMNIELQTGPLYNVTLTSKFTEFFGSTDDLKFYLIKENTEYQFTPVALQMSQDQPFVKKYTIDCTSGELALWMDNKGISNLNGFSLKVVRHSDTNSCDSYATKELPLVQ